MRTMRSRGGADDDGRKTCPSPIARVGVARRPPTPRRWSWVPLLIAGAALGGCGWFDDATKVTVCTDQEAFLLDLAQLGVSASGATLPGVPCDDGNDPCSQSGVLLDCGPQVSCSGSCGPGATGARTCQVDVLLLQGRAVDLSGQIDSSSKAKALSSVTLKRVEYSATQNTLNVETPETTFFVGPQTAQRPTDANVTRLGVLPPIPPGTTFTPKALDLEPAGQTALANFVRDYQTPFVLLGQAHLQLRAGDPVPAGLIELQFQACFQGDLL